MIYLIKTIICSGLLIGIYYLLFDNETNHKLKRAYLLASLIFSLIVPLLAFENTTEMIQTDTITYIQSSTNSTIITARAFVSESEAIKPINFFYAIYLSVSILLLFKFLRNSYFIFKLTNKNHKIKGRAYTIVLIENHTAPYSFLKYIFLNKVDYLDNKVEKEILKHEETHVLQHHSLDILFLELLKIFFWFNPFLPFYKKAIQINHEYLADESVISVFKNVSSYQYILFQKINQNNSVKFTSAFNYLTTKKRLIMMTKTTSKKVALCKQIAIIPLSALCFFLFSERTEAQTSQNKATIKNPNLNTHLTPSSNKDGITEEDMKIYKAIQNKYKTLSKNGKDSIWKTENIPAEEQAKLKKMYLNMSAEQQAKVNIAFIKRPSAFLPSIPSTKQYNSLKDKTEYGVWIDEKKVANTELENYSATDFKHIFISKLHGRAKEGRIYKYQADLMTKKFYDNYYAKWEANKDAYLMLVKVKMKEGAHSK